MMRRGSRGLVNSVLVQARHARAALARGSCCDLVMTAPWGTGSQPPPRCFGIWATPRLSSTAPMTSEPLADGGPQGGRAVSSRIIVAQINQHTAAAKQSALADYRTVCTGLAFSYPRRSDPLAHGVLWQAVEMRGRH